ncbi:MAG: hypothetical protein ABIS07_10915 [Dokdonella sp.]
MRLISGFTTALLFCAFAHAADAPSAMFGRWTFDATLSKGGDVLGDAASGAGSMQPAGTGHAHGTGARHGGGMASSGGGGGGGRHGGRHAGEFAGANASGSEREREKHERGLARLFATQLTILATSRRIRFDDGERPIELDMDGMNLSGAGVGGTVALTATVPELVIETLTDSGDALQERYRLSDDGAHLELHASLKHPGTDAARDILRVFDRATVATNRNAVSVQSPVR